MSEMESKNPDGALAALARAERAAWPEVSEGLRARVLADAAEVTAGKALAPAATARPARRGGAGLFGWFDAWAGAAVAAALICLAIGLGLGYGAGDALLDGAGLDDTFRVAEASTEDALFLGEDVL